MKIVYCLPQLYQPGGIERIVSIKANYLAEVCQYDVFIITACQQGKLPYYPFSEKVKFIDLDIDYDVTLTYPIWKRIAKKSKLAHYHKQKLSKILAKISPDITVSTFTHEAAFLPDVNDGSKKILEFHFCKGHKCKIANAFDFPLLTKLAYYFKCWQEEHIIIPKYDQFVVLTEEDKTDWQKQIPTVKCISNILPFKTNEQASLENKTVIAVGRLDAQKKFDRLITLWKEIHSKYPDWKLNIFGQGQDEHRLKNLIAALDLSESITIHQPSQNIKEEYLHSSIFVMTSAYEGLPMVLLEAIGLGLPAVCYDFKCGPRDVIVDGENGFLIKDGNSEAFIEKISRLIEDKSLRKKMGTKAKSLSERYSQEVIMQKWIELFNKITNDPWTQRKK